MKKKISEHAKYCLFIKIHFQIFIVSAAYIIEKWYEFEYTCMCLL